MTITEYLGKKPRSTLLLLGIALFVIVAGTDYLVHANYLLEFYPFYLVPISFFSWFIGKPAGIVVALLSVVAGFLIRLRATPMATAYGDALVWLVLYLSSVWMITQLKRLYEHEWHLSRIDPLTMVENRRAFVESLTRARSLSDRHGLSISIAYVDLDDFKHFNDRFGHTAGDQLLAVTAAAIRRSLRPTDIVARLGGDEFAVLLPDTGKETAEKILGRVRTALDRAMRERKWRMTFSIGVSSLSPPLASVQELIESADQAMYAAKNLGKKRLSQRDKAV